MRRIRSLLVLSAVLGLLLGPATTPAEANHFRFEAVITGTAEDVSDIPPTGRVFHCGEFEAVEIELVADTGNEIVEGRVEQPENHGVNYCADDDLADANGEIAPTDGGRDFRGRGVEWRIPEGDTEEACIEARIEESGRFDRVGTIVRGQLYIDIRWQRGPDPNDDDNCVGGETYHEDRLCVDLEVTIVPSSLSRFAVVGTARDCDPHP